MASYKTVKARLWLRIKQSRPDPGLDEAARDRQVRRLCFGLTFSIQATFNTQSGTKLLLRDPWFALPVTGFRRAPVQTLGLEKEDLVPL